MFFFATTAVPLVWSGDTQNTSHVQLQPPTRDPNLPESQVPSSARRKATTVVLVSPDADGKRPRYSVASAGEGLPTPTNTIENHNDFVRNDSNEPEYDSDASLISDIDTLINNLKAEGTMQPANTATDIVSTRLEQNDPRSIRAGSATAFLVDQSEVPAEERDGVKNEIARQGEYSGTLEDDNGGDHQDGRAVQTEHEDKGAGKDDCESANMSNPRRSITSSIAGPGALDFESKDVRQDENGVENM